MSLDLALSLKPSVPGMKPGFKICTTCNKKATVSAKEALMMESESDDEILPFEDYQSEDLDSSKSCLDSTLNILNISPIKLHGMVFLSFFIKTY